MTRYPAGSSGGRSDSGNNGEGGHGDRDEEEDGGDYTESGEDGILGEAEELAACSYAIPIL